MPPTANCESFAAFSMSARDGIKRRMNTDVPLPSLNWPQMEHGWVWLCGAGPGDPGLLTLHAANALRQADVVILSLIHI